MTELSFLIDLLLNHKLPKKTKDAIQTRIKDIEAAPQPRPNQFYQPPARPIVQAQAPSMQAKVEAMEAEREAIARGEAPVIPPILPQVGMLAPASPLAAQALQLRQQVIDSSLREAGGNFDPGRKSARKF